MSEAPPETPNAVFLDPNDAAYIEGLITKNEELLLEVNRLQHIIKAQDLDQVKRLREENNTLRHQLELLEVEHRGRDGIYSALKDLSEQFRTTYNSGSQFKSLEQQNVALKEELLRVTQSEEEARRAQQEAELRGGELNEEIAKLRATLQEMTSQLEIVENERKAVEKSHKEAIESLKARLAQSHKLQEEHVALSEKISAVTLQADERSRLGQERQSIVEKELALLRERYTLGEEQRRVAEEQKAQLQAELCRSKEVLLEKDKGFSAAFLKQKEELEWMRKKEVEELKKGIQEREARLQTQIERNLSLHQQMEILKAENAAMTQRYGMKAEDVVELQKRVVELREERSRKDTLQQRYQVMLSSSTSINSEIKDLFASMLDFQERQEAEMLTMLRIQEIQQEEGKKVYECNIRKLREENKSLSSEIQHLLKALNASSRSATTPVGSNATAGETLRNVSTNPQQDENAPVPPCPREAAVPPPTPVIPWGRNYGGNDPRGPPMLPPMSNGAPTAWYKDPGKPSTGRDASHSHVSCPRCTLKNRVGIAVCEACGSYI